MRAVDAGFGIVAAEEIVAVTLDEIERAVDILAGIDLRQLGSKARLSVSSRMDQIAKRVRGLRYDVVDAVRREGDWEGSGARTAEIFEQQTANVSWREAKNTIERAQAVNEELPEFREALRAGRITDEYVDAIRKVIRDEHLKAQLADEHDGERKLLSYALTMDVERFAKRVKAWAIKHAPKKAERKAKEEAQEEELHLFDKGYYWVINGRLTPINGVLVNNLLNAVMRTAYNGGLGAENASGASVATAGPGVQGEQANFAEGTEQARIAPPELRASALVELCARALEDGNYESAARVVPHVSVHCSLETLAVAEARYKAAQEKKSTGDEVWVVHPELGRKIAEIAPGVDASYFEGLEPATLDDGTPLTPGQLQMILADAQISRVVFGQESEVLDVGRRYRTATPAQARAVIARDRHCQFPGCTQPYSSSRIHHAHYWENGGNTDLDNLVMVCWHHHALIHREQITAIHYENGWEFVDAHGRVVRDPNDRQGRDDWWKRKCAENDQGRSAPILGIEVAS